MIRKPLTALFEAGKRVPRRIRFITVVFLANLAVFLLFRIGFLLYFIPGSTPLFSSPILKALYLGIKFDARLAALACLPVLFLSGIPPIDPFKKRTAKTAWTVYLVVTFAVILVVYLFDFGFFDYRRTRLDSTVLMFAENPLISLKMVWQSYAVIPVLIGYALLVFFYFRLVKKLISLPAFPPLHSKWKRVVVHVVFGFLLIGVIYGKLARYPLRWSEAFFSPDHFVSQFGVNPVLYFSKTFSTRAENYDIREVRKYYPLLADYYGIGEPERRELSLRRSCTPSHVIEATAPPNIVVIILETFAAYKVNARNDGLDPAPNFARLSRDGILFTRYFVPMENTSRSLFSFIFGIPDVTPGRYSSWHPLLVNQRTLLDDFTEYRKLYFLGGSANWGNIRGVLLHNIGGLTIFEEGSYRSPVHDVWGISDADLFMESNEALRAVSVKDKPFFAIIQTSGNHRPFLIPEDARGFRTAEVDSKILEKNGFFSLEEYNGFRFLDHCLGYYFDLARKEDYFNHTIFVIFGDHGTLGGAVDMRFGDLSPGSFHVPLLFYAPGYIKEPREISTVMSHLDLLPSLASFIGKSYINTTLGRNIFDPAFKDKMFAFTFTAFRTIPRIGLIEDEFYVNVEPGGAFHLYLLEPPPALEDVTARYPRRAERMRTMAKAILEYSRYLLYHNKKN